ncbi:MAG: hypothetical protein HWQ43_00285 [Nostoc sp. JL31]|uniref:hypothetical protein n=1 Tax=Nostoc sp. JL31 TaxID=2815395 RepID=UPI0025F30B98|nr:hypothetical protein [Nostoc sp. JL31]MBN3887666.1 hypothetical protein [Nostoc sp. JL31]
MTKDSVNLQQLNKSKQHPLTKLVKTLSAFDPADLLTVVAGLQLMPENADRSVRLEFLAHVVASINSKGFGSKPKVNLKQIEKICKCDSPGIEQIVWMEDPFNNPFTEAFTFHGGSYIVFPGIAEEPTFILRHLAKAIFLKPELFPSQQFQTEAHDILLAVLALSNEIAKRAGLERGVKPISAPRDNVFIPNYEHLTKLKQAVSFNRSELIDLFARHGVYFFSIENLILPLGNLLIDNYQINNGELLARPIVQTGDRYIVASPSMLLTVARNELIRLAIEYGVKDELVERYSAAVKNTVIESLGYINNRITSVPRPNPPDIPYFFDAFFGFDTDKAAYVALVPDSLAEYNPQEPFGCWHLDDIGVKLETRVKEIYDYVCTNLPGVNEVLFLLIIQGVGRSQMLGFNKPPEIEPLLLIGLSAGDLETITLLEGGNSLVLWKYAGASWRLKQQAEVKSFSELDKFSFYKDNGYTFYASDNNRPNLIAFAPDGAGALRQKVLRQRDFHAVTSYKSNSLKEVTSRFSTREIPIYFPKSILSRVPQLPALVVEGLALPIWIIGSELEDENQQNLRGLYSEFVETIAYWLWQFTPSLSPIIQSLAPEYSVIIIRLFLPKDKAWEHITEPQEISDEMLVELKTDSAGGILDVTISSAISALLESKDNNGERRMMQRILVGFRELIFEEEREKLSNQIISQIIDNHAPLGIKKKIFFLSLDTNPELDNAGLLPYRKVQAADEDELLDELGNYLSSVKNLKEGAIPDDKRTEVLQETVGFFYQELEKLVASLDPKGLLEYLIAYHEAIVYETEHHRLTIPTRLACFSFESEMVEKLNKEFPERQKAALASRFIIEYVATRPPDGIRPFSLSAYDRLQALASEIVTFGFESDLINFSLADLKLEMLLSGRLGTDRDQYEKARDAYMSIFTGGEIVRATRRFGHYWRKPKTATEKSALVAQFDAAATIEFGYSITELLEFFGAAMDIGRDIHPSVACLPLRELIVRLANQLGWTPERVSQALELLSLKPRSDFLKPDSPYKPADVFPWKFNRPLSYLRRPFLHRKRNGEVEILWGIRHLNAVSQYLVYLCLNGRLKATSKQMKQVMGELRNIEGEEFNDQVADLLEQNIALIVERRVKKIGNLKIKGEKGILGDIDVLAADSRRKCLIVIECKNFALARAPHEMANELTELLKGSGKEKSAVQHHQERINWVCSHLQEVLTWLRLEPTADWKVEPLIVTDYELATPHLWASAIPVVSLVELSKNLLQ